MLSDYTSEMIAIFENPELNFSKSWENGLKKMKAH